MNKRIFVLSDEVIHWNFVPNGEKKNVYREIWGTKSTQRFFESISDYFLSSPKNWSISGSGHADMKSENINPCDAQYNQVFATWNLMPDKALRIESMTQVGQSKKEQNLQPMQEAIAETDLLLIQDWNLDLRESALTQNLDRLKDKWIIYRTSSPIFEGELWQCLQNQLSENGVLLLRADDLRKTNVSISKGLSWEQTLEDLINEIYFKKNITLHPLRMIEYVIVSFGATATLLIHNPKNGTDTVPDIQFFFDSIGVEGYFEENHPGYLPGDLELLSALLSKEALDSAPNNVPQFRRAIRAHLFLRRAFLLNGSAPQEYSLPLNIVTDELDKVYQPEKLIGNKTVNEFLAVNLDFSLFEKICDHSSQNHDDKDWSLLGQTKWDLYSLARQIAILGPSKALSGWNIPIAKFKHLMTVDRKEMEFLHHLKTLITEYLSGKNNQPLSIAVFGSPGSGKSFAIKQLSRSLDLPDQKIEEVTFNLSQFNEENPADLYQAFHVVRDISLSGKIPLVFWDEFDSKNLAWLRYFLAPMQDGEFQEGQLTHNIGKSIFVFAGGTCRCMEQFEEKTASAKAEKGPDFLSRLKAFVNVLGPNAILPYSMEKNLGEDSNENEDLLIARNTDPEYVIRRAMLINSLLGMNYPQLMKNGKLQIDDGVLNAFLKIPKFKHGTRSMETIFKTSQLHKKQKYNRSDLPPVSQMGLHVDGQQFYELMSEKNTKDNGGEAFYHLVNEIVFDEIIVEKMAIGVHSMYECMVTGNQDPKQISREVFLEKLAAISALPENIPHDEVSQNYDSARKIPEKLNAIGIMIVPTNTELLAYDFTDDELERVSRLEHIRWVRHHIEAGWSYHPQKQKSVKLHNGLVAWDEAERQRAQSVYGALYTAKMGMGENEYLTEHYRNLDRAITRAIPWILESVGFKMVKMK
jgi:hypothetical protein